MQLRFDMGVHKGNVHAPPELSRSWNPGAYLDFLG